MTAVVWVDPDPHWDEGIIREMTAGPEWQHHRHFNPVASEGAVVVIPGQHHVNDADRLASWLDHLPWSLTIITSDEEALFPVETLPRDDRHAVFTQYHDRGMDRVIPIGAPPDTPTVTDDNRDLAISFVGQNTHARREELLATIKTMAVTSGNGNIAWLATTGFRQGLDRDEYLATLARTRIAPCPSGPHSLDSFRLYEALAAGALPVIEASTPHGCEFEFWLALFGPGFPIPTVSSWNDLPILVEHYAEGTRWIDTRDAVRAWYEGYREDLEIDFLNTIARLSNS